MEDAVEPLIRRCQAGERGAFKALFVQHREDVTRVVFRMLGPSLDLEDLVQEVFIQVFRNLGEFRGQSKFSTWLYRVSVNVVLMHRRAQKSRPRVADEGLHSDLFEGNERPVDEELARRERVRALYRLLDRLSEKKRTVFILHELEGASPVEIAELVQAPALTVRTRLFYARRELAAMLSQEPYLADLGGAKLRAPKKGGRPR